MQKFNELLHVTSLIGFTLMSQKCRVAGGGHNVSPCRIAVVSQKSKFFWPLHYDHSLRHDNDSDTAISL